MRINVTDEVRANALAYYAMLFRRFSDEVVLRHVEKIVKIIYTFDGYALMITHTNVRNNPIREIRRLRLALRAIANMSVTDNSNFRELLALAIAIAKIELL